MPPYSEFTLLTSFQDISCSTPSHRHFHSFTHRSHRPSLKIKPALTLKTNCFNSQSFITSQFLTQQQNNHQHLSLKQSSFQLYKERQKSFRANNIRKIRSLKLTYESKKAKSTKTLTAKEEPFLTISGSLIRPFERQEQLESGKAVHVEKRRNSKEKGRNIYNGHQQKINHERISLKQKNNSKYSQQIHCLRQNINFSKTNYHQIKNNKQYHAQPTLFTETVWPNNNNAYRPWSPNMDGHFVSDFTQFQLPKK